MTRPVTDRPKQGCAKQIINKLGDFLGIVAIIALITAIVNMCGFCGSFSLCAKGYDDDDDEVKQL